MFDVTDVERGGFSGGPFMMVFGFSALAVQ